MYFLVFFILSLTFYPFAKSACQVDPNFIRGKNYAFFSNNILMRTPYVREGATLELVCGQHTHQSVCRRGIFVPALPTADCLNNALSTTIERAQDPACTAPANLYRVGYTHRRLFTELYRTCYNPQTMEVIYVQNQVYKRPFDGQRPKCRFTADEVITLNEENSFLQQNIFPLFNELLGPYQQFVTQKRNRQGQLIADNIIDRGHLAPASDFLFHLNKCATFKLINVVPQFGAINKGNWILVEDYASTVFPNNQNVNNIKTGSFGILELPHSQPPYRMVKMFLLPDRSPNRRPAHKNPIPKYIYKIINSAIAFVSYNNPFANSLPNDLPCQPITCPNIIPADTKRPRSLTNFQEGYIFCCRVNELETFLLQEEMKRRRRLQRFNTFSDG